MVTAMICNVHVRRLAPESAVKLGTNLYQSARRVWRDTRNNRRFDDGA
jgi:hypothetical protein